MHKYRGKHNGGWKYGYLSFNFKTNEHEIVNADGVWPVITNSVSMWTGVYYDDDKTEAYFGDVCFRKAHEHNMLICWDDFEGKIYLKDLVDGTKPCGASFIRVCAYLGNKTDSPELLEAADA